MAPIPTLTPQTRAGTTKVVMLLSTGSETVLVEVEVDMASFEVVSSPVPQVALPATGVSSTESGGLALLVLTVGFLAVAASRRRFV